MDESPTSPLPQGISIAQTAPRETMSFDRAIKAVINGQRISRIEWEQPESYGLLKDGYLMILLNGTYHKWIVSDGDMLADDWFVLPNVN